MKRLKRPRLVDSLNMIKKAARSERKTPSNDHFNPKPTALSCNRKRALTKEKRNEKGQTYN